jgi:hypothetical protein
MRSRRIRVLLSIVIVTSVLGPAAFAGSAAADPSVAVDYDGDRVTVANGTTQVVSGTADTPVGTEILVRVRSAGETQPAFLKAKSGVVTENGTWAVSFNFSRQTAGDTFDLTARIENGSAETDVAGEIVACEGDCADTPPSGTPTPIPEQTATATPTAEPDAPVAFGEHVFVVEGGGVAAIPVSFEGDADEAVVVIGNETEANYELEAVVTDGDGDGAAVVYVDTAIAGRGGEPLSTSGGDSVAVRSETSLDSPLDPANYDVSLYAGGERSGSPSDVGSLVLQSTATRTATATADNPSTPVGGTDVSDGSGLDSLVVGGLVSGAFLVGGALLAAILLRR